MDDTTFDVRIYKTEIYQGTDVTTYTVRWKTGTREKHWRTSFRGRAQADSFRSSLVTAARRGEAFSLTTGRPVSWQRETTENVGNAMSWYELACAYTDMKWKAASAKYRQDIARALTAATPAVITADRGRPGDADLRRALHRWGFNSKQRANPPDDVASVLAWVAQNTMPVSALAEAATIRRVLDAATTRLDGRPAAASTARRHRVILANAMDFAVEQRELSVNPVRALKWSIPKTSDAVDRRSVVNPQQGRALLEAVRSQRPSGPRLVAFFGLMYYAGLRPEEAVILGEDNVTIPALILNKDTGLWEEPEDDWGELDLRSAAPDAGRQWTDDGSLREIRQLKHRPVGDSRTVPAPPPLTRLLRAHMRDFGTGPDGRLFMGVHGRELSRVTYRRAWTIARATALSPQELASPLARRPYDLRHACLSTWLNAGVPPTQVAEWAGHSVEVLLRIYAKCIVGQDQIAKRRIFEALGEGIERHHPDTAHDSGDPD